MPPVTVQYTYSVVSNKTAKEKTYGIINQDSLITYADTMRKKLLSLRATRIRCFKIESTIIMINY